MYIYIYISGWSVGRGAVEVLVALPALFGVSTTRHWSRRAIDTAHLTACTDLALRIVDPDRHRADGFFIELAAEFILDGAAAEAHGTACHACVGYAEAVAAHRSPLALSFSLFSGP